MPHRTKRLLDRRQQLPHGEAVVALRGGRPLRRPRSRSRSARACRRARCPPAVGPAVLEHQVHPLLQKRWTEYQKNGCCRTSRSCVFEQLLLAAHVDVEVGVRLVEVVERRPATERAAAARRRLTRDFSSAGWAKTMRMRCIGFQSEGREPAAAYYKRSPARPRRSGSSRTSVDPFEAFRGRVVGSR